MRFAVALIFAVQLSDAAVPPAAAEKALRSRADQFYTFLVAKQYRKSEVFVLPADRDTYYAMEKPLIYDYRIKSVTVEANRKIATLELESTTKVRKAMIGEMKLQLSYLSHWKLIDGEWFWFIPSTEVRDTPFGKMVFTKNGLGRENGDSIKKKMGESPSPAALLKAVEVSASAISLGDKAGDSAILSFRNTLAGRVKLVLADSANPLFTLKLWPVELGEGDRATLIVKRTAPGPLQPTQIVVKVEPTQQRIPLQVR